MPKVAHFRQFSETKKQVSKNDIGIRSNVDLALAHPPGPHYMLAASLLLSRCHSRPGAISGRFGNVRRHPTEAHAIYRQKEQI